MANNRVYTESVVTLNNQEALARIDEMKNKAAQLHAELLKVAMTEKEGIKSKAWQQKKKELDAVYASMKSINEEHKAFDKILNNINGSSYNALTKAARMLEAQVKKLKPGTEQFIAASKKLKEVRTRMKEIEDQTRGTQQLFGTFFSKIKWTALVTGAVALFRKLGKDMTEETFRISGIWKRETAGMKGAYEAFVASIGSGKGWQQMIADISGAYEAARHLQDTLAEVYRMNNALQLKESEYASEIQENRQIMYDVTYSYAEREAAAQRVIDLEAELARDRKAIAEQELEANTRVLEQRSQMTEEERDFFIRGYNDNKALIDQAYTYKDALEKIASTKRMIAHFESGDPTTGVVDAVAIKQAETYRQELSRLEDQVADTSAEVVQAYGILTKYGQLNKDIVDGWVNAAVKYNQVEGDLTKTTRRATTIRNKMRLQAANEAQQAQNKAYQDALKASDEHYKELNVQLKQSYLRREISEEEYQARTTDLQKKSLADRIAIAERYRQSVVEMQSQLLDLSIAERQKLEKLIDDLEKDATKVLEKFLKDTEKAIDDFLEDEEKELADEVDAMIEEQLRHELDLIKMAMEARRELYPLEAIKAEMNEELEALKELKEKELITEKEYQQRRAQLAARYGAQIAETATKYTGEASALIDAIQEAAAARLEAQMQAELTAAGDNAEKRSEIEEKYEQRKLDLEKRYADVDMAIKIANTTASGAAAAVRAYEEGGPYAGPALAALIAATTAIQIATIVAQRNAIKNSSVNRSSSSSSIIGSRTVTQDGYGGGGYTEKAPSDATPVGVVHANEWVAPASMVRANPVTFATLESVRRSGNYRSGLAGFADGGPTSGAMVPAAINPADREVMNDIRKLLNELVEAMPIHAYVVLSELNAKQELDARIKKTVGK